MRKGLSTTLFRLILLITLWATLMSVTGCRQRQLPAPRVDIGEELAFETMEAEEDYEIGMGKAYPNKESAYYVIWTREDVDQIEQWISASAVEQLNELDFSKYAALAVFQGRKGTNGYNVVIEHIGVKEGTLVIVAQFWQNPPGAPSGDVTTSPYQLIRITKENLISPQVTVEFHNYTQYHIIKIQ